MFDLGAMSLEELRNLRVKVERAITTYEERKRREALSALEAAAREHGYSLSELTGDGHGRRTGKAIPKYSNPDNPSQTWTGRGRRPFWIQVALDTGYSMEDLAINK